MFKKIFTMFIFIFACAFSNSTYIDFGLSHTNMKNITEVPISNDIDKEGFNLSITHYFLPIQKINTDVGVGIGYTKSGDRDVYHTQDYKYEGFCFDNLPIFISFKTKLYEKNKFKISLKNNIGYTFNIGEDNYNVDKRYEEKIHVVDDIYFTYDKWKRYASEELDVKNGLHYSISLMAEYEYIQGGIFYTINKAEGELADKSINLDRNIYGVFFGVNF